MESVEPRFFATQLEIALGASVFSMEAWVSSFGVARLLLPTGLDLGADQKAQVRFEGFSAEARLVRQFTEAGLSFGARFLQLDQEQSRFLNEQVKKRGLPPLWMRRFPRIQVSTLGEAPHPQMCVFPWQGKDYKFEVLNFTVDGLRLRHQGLLPSLRVGSPITLSVYSSSGTGISQLEAETRNFTVIESESTTEVGIRFTDSRSPSREAYRGLIRDCLVSLQKRKP